MDLPDDLNGRHFVKLKRAAYIADVDTETVCTWIRDGRLPAYEMPNSGDGKRIHKRVRLSELLAFLATWKRARVVENHDSLGI